MERTQKEKELNLQTLYANIRTELLEAQNCYEDAIKQYGKFRNNFVESKIDYEKSSAEEIEKLKLTKDTKVTIVKEIAKKNCIEKYSKMLYAETQYKYYGKLSEALCERIQTIKKYWGLKFANLNNN